MKRRIIHLAGFVLLGVLLNVGIAWWCIGAASWRETWSFPGSDPEMVGPIQWIWPERAARVPDAGEPNVRYRSAAPGALSISVIREGPMEIGSYTAHSQHVYRAGWPLRALEARWQYPPVHQWRPRYFTDNIWSNSWEQGLCITDGRWRRVVLPLLPRWPAFVANTLIYAAITWGLIVGLAGMSRARRRRRGHCRACNYDLRGVSTCPECGGGASTSPRGNPKS